MIVILTDPSFFSSLGVSIKEFIKTVRLTGFFYCIKRIADMDKIPMTIDGHKLLSDEFTDLKKVQRPQVIEDIAEARAHGDLSENAEYHAAKERQSFIEGRIQELEAVLGRADVINTSKFTGDMVRFGAKVTVVDEDTDEEKTYQIVGDYEGDIENNKVSLTSPIARALIGKSVGDSVSVATPKGGKDYEILKVVY
jgi:transcription elongation factor GreA